MASKFDTTKAAKLLVSRKSVTAIGETAEDGFVGFACTTKDASINRGQKSDIDVTTLCSEEQESTNGLPASGEVTLNTNWVGKDEGQDILDEAYESDEVHEFKLILKSGYGFHWLGEVRQADVSIPVNGVAAGSYNIRIKGKVKKIKPEAVPESTPATAKATAAKAVKE